MLSQWFQLAAWFGLVVPVAMIFAGCYLVRWAVK